MPIKSNQQDQWRSDLHTYILSDVNLSDKTHNHETCIWASLLTSSGGYRGECGPSAYTAFQRTLRTILCATFRLPYPIVGPKPFSNFSSKFVKRCPVVSFECPSKKLEAWIARPFSSFLCPFWHITYIADKLFSNFFSFSAYRLSGILWRCYKELDALESL